MNIAFDAKRAFQNTTGLGNYSRSLISALAIHFPEHHYYLFAPKQTRLFDTAPYAGMQTVLPQKPLHRWFRAAWRSKYVVKDLLRHQVDLYHGLSHEIPFGIHRSGIKSVVTMHDLIFERYPAQYNPLDVLTYRRKAKYACLQADKVVAISRQTKEDLVTFYDTPPEKIAVVYQSCDPMFGVRHAPTELQALREGYGLPAEYLLYVGSVIERKNLLGIVKALHLLKGRLDMPLVVLGDGRAYKKQVKAFIAAHGMEQRVIWLNERRRPAYTELPLLYQGAQVLLYPSVFEGFGIPILEALWSRTPVITSRGSCFAETAGEAALYVDPLEPASIAGAIQQLTGDTALAQDMREKGWTHAHRFTPDKCAAAMMEVYKSM
ncbi:glycosyltransferase family 4 protein [Chitinophaga japonensis]|uniref:Glycosyltransferase involved in cell wall biosynthesis n=1 Tax=Chitinophaga japonensis TaxID=104662 RepID=A0A562T6C9_CHIJA|nr:glycosyltransferase family 1 protein [Chitinophaga japonensis]TWI88828.1 glycosyltransferase involved in cell wall biosynthesis [Chitinophaga japonensis]